MPQRQMSYLRPGESAHVTGYRILVEVEKDERYVGSILLKSLEEGEKKGAERGIIREIGPLAATAPGESLKHWGLEVGNTVFFNRYEGYYFEDMEGTPFICLNSEQAISMVVYPEETAKNLKQHPIEETEDARA